MALDFDGKRYTQASTHQREWGEKLIGSLDLGGHERILDLGCGDGVITLELAKRVPHGEVVGIDASKGMLEVALQRRCSNLHFELLDINDLSFDEEFDLVFSNATLHFVKHHEQIVHNVYRALRTGGVFRCNFGADGNCVSFIQATREAMEAEEYVPFFRNFEWPYYMPKIDDYTLLLKESAFEHVDVWGENADRHFPDEDAITRWIDQPSIVPFLRVVDEALKSSFRNMIVSRVLELTHQKDGTYFETFRRVNVNAVR